MEFKFSFTKQPAARSMVARTISEADMLRLTIAKLHASNAQNDRLTGELETANQRIKAMQQRNEALWDSYQDLRSTVNRAESSQNAQEGQGCDKNAPNEQSSTRIHKEAVVNSVPVQNGNECNEQEAENERLKIWGKFAYEALASVWTIRKALNMRIYRDVANAIDLAPQCVKGGE